MENQQLNDLLIGRSDKVGRQSRKQHPMKSLQRNCLTFQENVVKQITYNPIYVLNDKQNFGNNEHHSGLVAEQDLLWKHKEAVQKLMNKNMIFQVPQALNIRQQQIRVQKHTAIFKDMTLDNYLHLLLAQLRALKPSLVKRFHSYLKAQKHFYRFLQHLYYSYPHFVIHRLFKYLFFTWQLYYPSLLLHLGFAQSIQISNLISDKILQKQLASQINRCNKYLEQLGRTIKGLVATVVLVMSKHLPNPLLSSGNSLAQKKE